MSLGNPTPPPLPPTIPAGWTLDHIESPYDYFKVKRRYIWNNGVMALPVAIQSGSDNYPQEDPPPANSRVPSAVCRTNSPVGWYVISWAAQRTGKEPKIPDPQQQLPMYSAKYNILIYKEIEVETPELVSDSKNHRYRNKGIYVYCMIQPVWGPDDGLFEGATPYDNAAKSTYSPFNFDENL